VPARPRKPKDKALVEGGVKIVMRLFRWKFRRHMFTSLKEINQGFAVCTQQINNRPHTRFKVSRESSFLSKPILKQGGPMVEPLRKTAYFKRVFLEAGAPTWPNGYDICADLIFQKGVSLKSKEAS
jgi:hypothetical protein